MKMSAEGGGGNAAHLDGNRDHARRRRRLAAAIHRAEGSQGAARVDRSGGERAAYLVDMLTERHGGGNRTIRKWRELRRLQTTFDSDVHTLKLIDLADNAPSIILHDPKFAPVFVAEATALLDALWLAQRDARRLLIAGLMGKPEK